ncbi:MAG: DUF2304 domain-containing protein [Phycisphaerales bacterium]
MTPFQIILVAVLSIVALATVALALRGSIGRLASACWLVVTGAGIVFAIRPNWTTDIAHLLGISRGTDLLLYMLVLAVLQGFLLIYLKLRRVRRELTILVRELAIREAERRGDGGSEQR